MIKLSRLSLAFAVYIILSAAFMLQLRNGLISQWGEASIRVLFYTAALLIAGLLFVLAFYRRVGWRRVVFLAGIVGLAFGLIQVQPYFIERTHVLTYGILGWIIMRDVRAHPAFPLKIILQGLLFASMVSLIDELFQGLLPYRVFDLRDIRTNILSAILGGSAILSIQLKPIR